MNTLLRLSVLALLAAAVAPEALAQDRPPVLITHDADGLRMAAPGDTPVGEMPAALVTQNGARGWSLRTLMPGDVPSEVAARPLPTVTRLSGSASDFAFRPSRSRTVRPAFSEIVDIAPEALVSYTVSGRVLSDAPAFLVRLSETETLTSITSTTHLSGGSRIEAEFSFDSVEAWAEWDARPETKALLAPLADSQTNLNVRIAR